MRTKKSSQKVKEPAAYAPIHGAGSSGPHTLLVVLLRPILPLQQDVLLQSRCRVPRAPRSALQRSAPRPLSSALPLTLKLGVLLPRPQPPPRFRPLPLQQALSRPLRDRVPQVHNNICYLVRLYYYVLAGAAIRYRFGDGHGVKLPEANSYGDLNVDGVCTRCTQ